MLLKDSKGEKSTTVTVLWLTLSVALIKVLVSGISYKGISAGDFSASDFAIMAGSAFTFYWGRKNVQVGKGDK